MPVIPASPCRMPGCRRTVAGGRFCEAHRRERDSITDSRRGKTVERGYGGLHRKHRAYVLKRDPLCVECLKHDRIRPSKIADHIIALQDGGEDSTDNLQGLCVPCHNTKTAGERLARQRARVGAENLQGGRR